MGIAGKTRTTKTREKRTMSVESGKVEARRIRRRKTIRVRVRVRGIRVRVRVRGLWSVVFEILPEVFPNAIPSLFFLTLFIRPWCGGGGVSRRWCVSSTCS